MACLRLLGLSARHRRNFRHRLGDGGRLPEVAPPIKEDHRQAQG